MSDPICHSCAPGDLFIGSINMIFVLATRNNSATSYLWLNQEPYGSLEIDQEYGFNPYQDFWTKHE